MLVLDAVIILLTILLIYVSLVMSRWIKFEISAISVLFIVNIIWYIVAYKLLKAQESSVNQTAHELMSSLSKKNHYYKTIYY